MILAKKVLNASFGVADRKYENTADDIPDFLIKILMLWLNLMAEVGDVQQLYLDSATP
ncbi:MAG: hypothetical protein WBG73_07610 [Coleofasciculaceae cyanobacterium]